MQRWLSELGREMGELPFHPDSFCPHPLKSSVFAKRSDTSRRGRAAASNLGHSAHQFWHDDIGLVEAMALLRRKLVGHQQVTDAYLLALAIHNKGRLATLDRKLTGLLPEKTAARDVVIVI